MRSVQVSKPKGPLEIVEREIPEPEGQGTVGREPDDSWLFRFPVLPNWSAGTHCDA
jgi:hypothetical protein